MAKTTLTDQVNKITPFLILISTVIGIWAGAISIIRAIKERKAQNDLKNAKST